VERVRSEPLETAVPAADTGQGDDDLLDQLTADRRDAFVATQLGGLSYAEAADALGCPIGTVRSRVARARADLLALLTDAEAS
jgi:RNA polymerase sigma-70 factor (ECF subfamily)